LGPSVQRFLILDWSRGT